MVAGFYFTLPKVPAQVPCIAQMLPLWMDLWESGKFILISTTTASSYYYVRRTSETEWSQWRRGATVTQPTWRTSSDLELSEDTLILLIHRKHQWFHPPMSYVVIHITERISLGFDCRGYSFKSAVPSLICFSFCFGVITVSVCRAVNINSGIEDLS